VALLLKNLLASHRIKATTTKRRRPGRCISQLLPEQPLEEIIILVTTVPNLVSLSLIFFENHFS